MTLLHIALNQVDEARLQALITAGAAESRTIDYKRTSYGNANADYSEFLARDNLSNSLDRDQYHFDEVIFETVATSRAECAIVMRPILDQMANAGGTATSPIFDDQGHCIPLTR